MNKLQALRIKAKEAELSRRLEAIYKTHVREAQMPEAFWVAFEQLDTRFSQRMLTTENDMEMSSICRTTEAEFIKMLKAT